MAICVWPPKLKFGSVPTALHRPVTQCFVCIFDSFPSVLNMGCLRKQHTRCSLTLNSLQTKSIAFLHRLAPAQPFSVLLQIIAVRKQLTSRRAKRRYSQYDLLSLQPTEVCRRPSQSTLGRRFVGAIATSC